MYCLLCGSPPFHGKPLGKKVWVSKKGDTYREEEGGGVEGGSGQRNGEMDRVL